MLLHSKAPLSFLRWSIVRVGKPIVYEFSIEFSCIAAGFLSTFRLWEGIMSEDQSDRLAIDQLASDLSLETPVVVEKMEIYNDSLKNGSVTPKTLKNWTKSGIAVREHPSRNWTIGFLGWLTEQHGLEVDANEVVKIINTLTAVKAKDIKSEPKKRRAQSDLDAFASRLQQAASKNSIIADNRERQSGYYRVVRKTTQDNTERFYEEPLFIGSAGNPTWLISDQNGLNEGFTFSTMGVTNVMLSHSHDRHVLGIRVLQLDFDADSRGRAFSGVMLRLSDRAFRPAASKIVAIKLDPESAEVSAWREYASNFDPNNDNALQHSLVNSISPEHARYALYQSLNLDEHLKAELSSDWDALKKQILDDD